MNIDLIVAFSVCASCVSLLGFDTIIYRIKVSQGSRLILRLEKFGNLCYGISDLDNMSDFTPEEEKILERYVTNLDDDVFVLTNLPEVVKGALFSRYSRTPKSVRRLLLDEFINDEESGFKEIVGTNSSNVGDQMVATRKAEDFYDRVLVGYGDDSVAELAGVHIAIENVSQIIGAKALEDNRIGISPLEKSTRYVRYDDKVDGEYRYYRDAKIMDSKLAKVYVQVCDELFDTYALLVEKLLEYLRIRFPKETDVKQWVYEATIRAKACDLCRELLPLGTLTNVGLFGNGRAFEYLIIKMMTSPYVEVRDVAQKMKRELDKVIPSFVKRATNERGEVTQNYLRQRYEEIKKVIQQMPFTSEKNVISESGVSLKEYDMDGEEQMIAGMLFEQMPSDWKKVLLMVKSLDGDMKRRIVDAYCSRRHNRHHKLGRALELTDYVFEVISDVGTYKDLQRHRMLTPFKQSYSTDYGYAVPDGILEAGLEKMYRKAMDGADKAFRKLAAEFPDEAQYVIPLGYRCRWLMKMNLREVCHFTELRSIKQGHPGYRKVAQEVANLVKKVHPMVGAWATQFVDYGTVELERLEAEKKTEEKKERMRKVNKK